MGVSPGGDDGWRLVVSGGVIDCNSRGIAMEAQQVIICLAYFIGFRLFIVFRRFCLSSLAGENNPAWKFKPPERRRWFRGDFAWVFYLSSRNS
jgi:hypothetical protein